MAPTFQQRNQVTHSPLSPCSGFVQRAATFRSRVSIPYIALLAFVLAACCPLVGCGGSNEAKVIQPTENYQPTEQEKQNATKAAASKEFGN